MASNNPWFWGGKTRFEFERELQKSAVYLHSKNAPKKVVKVDIEAVKARKNALIAKGILRASTTTTTTVTVAPASTGVKL